MLKDNIMKNSIAQRKAEKSYHERKKKDGWIYYTLHAPRYIVEEMKKFYKQLKNNNP